MSEDIKMEDIEKPLPSEGQEATPEKEQDPLKVELEKVQKGGRTKREKLIFTKKRVEEQLRELEGEEGTAPEPEGDDDKPLTVGEFKKMQQQQTVKTALELADNIPYETERELVKFHLKNTIVSSGNPTQDLQNAQAIVNSKKNSAIVQQLDIKGTPKTHPSGGGAGATEKPHEEFTPMELAWMRPPFNVTKEEIYNARKGKAPLDKK